MTSSDRHPRIIIALISSALGLFIALSSGGAAADEGSGREAGKHFGRAVALYGEADYRAALVEFKRAYSLSPNASVLYNVGETEYQLQDYAGALSTFERYLAEASPTEAHRAEVESNVDVLRSRVGHVTVVTVPPGADVTVDDQAVGKTPLERSILVSIGRRKVVASMAGRPPVSRYVDVAADDNALVTLQLPNPSDAQPQGPPQASLTPRADAATTSSSGAGSALRTLGWVTTGASAVGAITFGALAVKASNDLKAARGTYPTTGATLTHDASMTTTYSALADALTATALVVGGITLISTALTPSSSSKRGSAAPQVRVSLAPTAARFEVTF